MPFLDASYSLDLIPISLSAYYMSINLSPFHHFAMNIFVSIFHIIYPLYIIVHICIIKVFRFLIFLFHFFYFATISLKTFRLFTTLHVTYPHDHMLFILLLLKRCKGMRRTRHLTRTLQDFSFFFL